MTFKIYAAGPISGLSFDASEAWRDELAGLLPHELRLYSPLRAKDYLKSETTIEQSYTQPLSTDRGIMTRDHYDCQTADLIICNLMGVERISVGSVMEIAWAYAYRKPLIMIMEHNNAHNHPMVREAVSFAVGSVEEAAKLATAILLPGYEKPSPNLYDPKYMASIGYGFLYESDKTEAQSEV